MLGSIKLYVMVVLLPQLIYLFANSHYCGLAAVCESCAPSTYIDLYLALLRDPASLSQREASSNSSEICRTRAVEDVSNTVNSSNEASPVEYPTESASESSCYADGVAAVMCACSSNLSADEVQSPDDDTSGGWYECVFYRVYMYMCTLCISIMSKPIPLRCRWVLSGTCTGTHDCPCVLVCTCTYTHGCIAINCQWCKIPYLTFIPGLPTFSMQNWNLGMGPVYMHVTRVGGWSLDVHVVYLLTIKHLDVWCMGGRKGQWSFDLANYDIFTFELATYRFVSRGTQLSINLDSTLFMSTFYSYHESCNNNNNVIIIKLVTLFMHIISSDTCMSQLHDNHNFEQITSFN